MATMAISATRWRYDNLGAGRWWYVVTVQGAREALYEVSLVHEDGRAPLPYKVERAGRTSRSIGRSGGALRREIERAAIEAIAAAPDLGCAEAA